MQPAGRFAGGTALSGWKLCEDFAPQDGATRVRGEGGAKSGGRRAAGRVKTGVGNVKILLPWTKPQGLAGSGEQTGRPKVLPAQRLCGRRQPTMELSS